MELDAIRVAATHFSNLLPLAHRLIFLDQQSLVVGIGRQVSVVVLEDDQVAIAPQTGPNIDDAAIGGSQHRVAGRASNIERLVLDLIKAAQHKTNGGPDP